MLFVMLMKVLSIRELTMSNFIVIVTYIYMKFLYNNDSKTQSSDGNSVHWLCLIVEDHS